MGQQSARLRCARDTPATTWAETLASAWAPNLRSGHDSGIPFYIPNPAQDLPVCSVTICLQRISTALAAIPDEAKHTERVLSSACTSCDSPHTCFENERDGEDT